MNLLFIIAVTLFSAIWSLCLFVKRIEAGTNTKWDAFFCLGHSYTLSLNASLCIILWIHWIRYGNSTSHL